MRIFLAIYLATLSIITSANTTDTREFTVGAQSQEVITLYTEKTRVEYRTEQREATCYRTEYRLRCRILPGPCRRVCDLRGFCRTQCLPHQTVCRDFPVTVPYSCVEDVEVAYDVFDYNVETQLTFHFSYEEESVSENIRTSVTGDKVKLEVLDSKEFAVLLTNKTISQSRQGDTKYQQISYDIKFTPVSKITDLIGAGIENLTLSGNHLNFHFSHSFNKNLFRVRLRLLRRKLIGRDPTIFNSELLSYQYQVDDHFDKKQISIDLKELGINIPRRIRAILEVQYAPNGAELLNDVKISSKVNKRLKR